MYLLKTAWISLLMLGCRTARSRSIDTTGSVKLDPRPTPHKKQLMLLGLRIPPRQVNLQQAGTMLALLPDVWTGSAWGPQPSYYYPLILSAVAR